VNIRPPGIKRLFALPGNQCVPKLQTPIVEGETVLGQVCHIAGASAHGPRYDASQTDEEPELGNSTADL